MRLQNNITIMEQKENKNVLNIDIPADVMDGVYSKMTVVSHSQEEFVIDFVRLVPGSNKARVKSRVVMSPVNAKRTLAALQENLMKYTVEGQEPEKTVTAPGRDSGKAGRASVLEKLSDAKRQEKAAPLKAPDKKKEDIHR